MKIKRVIFAAVLVCLITGNAFAEQKFSLGIGLGYQF